MDAVTLRTLLRRRAAACVLALLAVLAPPALAQAAGEPPPAAPPVTAPAPPATPSAPPATPSAPPATAPAQAPAADPAALLHAAEDAFSQADFEKVRDLALQVLAALDREPAEQAGQPEATRLRARALDLAAQAYYNLGDKAAMGSAMDQLLTVDPGRRVDPATAGPKFVALLEERRRKLVGRLAPTCTPQPCEQVRVDGRLLAPDADGELPVLAGSRAVVLGRRNFRDKDLGPVTVAAGEKTAVQATLEQVARDVVLTTTPAGVRVVVDGKEIGTTAPGSGGGASQPLLVASLPPGPHVFVFQAPCYRRLEQSVDVVLDAQNLEPQTLGPLSLDKARAAVEVKWDQADGVLAVDGQPIQPGKVEQCPGAHEASLTLGGRRVWFETVDLADGETRALAPRPRPTAALVPDESARGLTAFPGKAWNVVSLEAAAAAALARAVTERKPGAAPPVFPAAAHFPAAGLAALAHAAAPEADLVFLRLQGLDALRSLETLALVDTRRDIVEWTAWPDKDTKTADALAAELVRSPAWGVRVAGFDIAERDGRASVIASVLPNSPAAAAGLAAGQVLAAVDGKPFRGGAADLEHVVAGLAPDAPLTLKVVQPAGAEQEIHFTPPLAVNAPDPAALRGQTGVLLTPLLARAGVARLTGAALERAAAGALEGLGLAALGLDADAAAALDRVSVDDELDPAQDARATVAFVLERLLRKLGRADYAAEVRARWRPLKSARFGGRSGPPLRAADSPLAD